MTHISPFEKAFLGLFEGFAMQTISEKYLEYLREYIADHPGQKEEIVNALKMFVKELEQK